MTHPVDQIEIYTDGSFQPGKASESTWSFVVIGHTPEGCRCLDVQYGYVAIDPMEQGWVGEHRHNAKAGESTALVRAMEWAIRNSYSCSHCFRFDAQAVGFAAAGVYGMQHDDIALKVVRSLALAVEVLLDSRVDWQHVKSHTGVLGNELADCLAKYVIQVEKEEVSFPEYETYVVGETKAIELLWLAVLPCQEQEALPQASAHHLPFGVFQQETGTHGRLPEELLCPGKVFATAQKRLCLSTVSYNVSTLQPKKGGVFVAYLRAQLTAAKIHITFLQETRSRESNLVVSESHLRVVAAAEQGKGGIEIWLLRKDPDTGRICFDKHDIRVLFAAPGLMFVRASFKGITLLLCGGHAPHSSASSADIDAFWALVRSEYHKWRHITDHFICGFDANAHFATPAPPHIGDYGLEEHENAAAKHFRDFLVHVEAFVPSSFEEYHQGSTATWYSNAWEGGARCDYIALPLAWRTGEIHSKVDPTLDAGNAGEDHLPLRCSIDILVVGKYRKKDRMSFDRKALQSCPLEKLQRLFCTPPDIPWSTNIDRHATTLSTWVQTQLAKAFPPQAKGPKKSYISDETWKIRTTRIATRQLVCAHKAALQLVTLRAAWQALESGNGWQPRRCILHGLVQFAVVQAGRKRTMSLTKQLRKGLQSDRTKVLHDLGERAKSMPQKELLEALKTFGVRSKRKPGSISPLPMIRGPDGAVLDSFEEVAACWRRHFAEQEDGLVQTAEALMCLHDSDAKEYEEEVLWQEIPTRMAIEAAFRRTSVNRAFFVDGVPGDLLSKLPSELARAYYPLMLKQSVFAKEALLHKGGRLVPSFKKGSPADMNCYRSLFVSSVIGKALRRVYRERLGPILDDHRMSLQLGGLAGHSITQASHVLSLFHRSAIRQQESVAILFIDVQNAFYKLLRRLFVDGVQDVRSVGELFHSLGLPDESHAEFAALLEEDTVLESSQATFHTKRMFAEFYKTTWFSVPGCTDLTWTRRGSRPGDSFADIAFGFALAKLLTQVEAQLVAKYPFVQIEWNGQATPFADQKSQCLLSPVMPVWADDIAIAVKHKSAEALVQELPGIAALVLHRLVVAGLTPNLKASKTELFVDIRGPRSLKVKRWLSQQEYKLELPTALVQEPLRLVGYYKHLGTYIQRNGSLEKELKVKHAVAHDSFTRYKSQIFSNRTMDLEKKVQLFRSLVLSAATYNCAIWQPETKRQQRQLRGNFQMLYKRLAMGHFGIVAKEWSMIKTCAVLGLPMTEYILREHRLRYFLKILMTGQPHLWALLQQEQAWFHLLKEDVQCLRAFCPEAEVPELTENDWHIYQQWAQDRPLMWKRLIRKMMARCLAHQRREYEWNTWNAAVVHELRQAGALPSEKYCPGSQHFCLRCKKSCKRASDLAVHAFKKHGRVTEARQFVIGSQCCACLKHYSSYVNLVNHVKNSRTCLQFYRSKPTVVQPEPGVNSRSATAAKGGLEDPHFVAQGPHELFFVASHDTDPQIEHEVKALKRRWTTILDDAPEQDVFPQRLRTETCETYLYPDEIMSAFLQWVAEAEDTFLLHQLSVCAQFEASFTFGWLLTGQAECVRDEGDVFICIEKHLSNCEAFPFQVVRQPAYQPVVFAHLFSGHRRKGDVQMWLESAGAMALSIDIIFDLDMGDLSRPETFAFFAKALKDNVLNGLLAGPPCETWSRARGTALADGSKGPRVVRTQQRPSGILSLTKAEDKQVLLGSRLLGIAVHLLVIALCVGASGLLEHPAEESHDFMHVSIWRTSIMRLLLKYPGCRKLRVCQGYYGAAAIKPTDLLLINIDASAEEFLLKSRKTKLPTTAAIGKLSDGTWATTRLKAYPEIFCEALSQLLLRSQPVAADSPPIPHEFVKACKDLMQSFDEGAAMGADFCGKQAQPLIQN